MIVSEFINKNSHVKAFAIEVAGLSLDSPITDFVKLVVGETIESFLERASTTLLIKRWASSTFAIAVNSLYKALKSIPTESSSPELEALITNLDVIKRELLRTNKTRNEKLTTSTFPKEVIIYWKPETEEEEQQEKTPPPPPPNLHHPPISDEEDEEDTTSSFLVDDEEDTTSFEGVNIKDNNNNKGLIAQIASLDIKIDYMRDRMDYLRDRMDSMRDTIDMLRHQKNSK